MGLFNWQRYYWTISLLQKFKVVLVIILTHVFKQSLHGGVHFRAKPVFSPTSVRNAVNMLSYVRNRTNICLIIQPNWTRNEFGWNNQVYRESASSDTYQDLTVACCHDLGFFYDELEVTKYTSCNYCLHRILWAILCSRLEPDCLMYQITDELGAKLCFVLTAVKSSFWLSLYTVCGTT